MNTSLLAVQTPSGSSGSTPGGSVNSSVKQQDGPFPGGFGPVLDQAQTTQATDLDGDATLPDEAQELAAQLQSLPGGGKLLPLLQQVLDSGADRQQVIDRITARLEQAGAGDETDTVAALAAMLNQMLEPVPGMAQALTAETINLAGVAGSGKAPGTAGEPASASRSGRHSVSAAVANERPVSGDALAEGKTSLFDKSLAELQQTPELRQNELSSLLAAIKRQLGEAGKSADILPRPEVLSATGSASSASTPTAVAPPGQTTLNLATPFNQAGWDQALGERVQWLASQNIQGARITLNPANLGPMEVRIQVQNDQASVQFTSAHGVVRDALEAALPRLRDMFAASGVELVDVDVAGQSFAGQQHGNNGEGMTGTIGSGSGQDIVAGADAGLELLAETPLATFLAPGRLDIFA